MFKTIWTTIVSILKSTIIVSDQVSHINKTRAKSRGHKLKTLRCGHFKYIYLVVLKSVKLSDVPQTLSFVCDWGYIYNFLRRPGILLQEGEIPTHSDRRLSQIEASAHCFSRIHYYPAHLKLVLEERNFLTWPSCVCFSIPVCACLCVCVDAFIYVSAP